MSKDIPLEAILYNAQIESWGIPERTPTDGWLVLDGLRQLDPLQNLSDDATEDEKRIALLEHHTKLTQYVDALERNRVYAERYFALVVEDVIKDAVSKMELARVKDGRYSIRMEMRVEGGIPSAVLMDLGKHSGKRQIYCPGDVWDGD